MATGAYLSDFLGASTGVRYGSVPSEGGQYRLVDDVVQVLARRNSAGLIKLFEHKGFADIGDHRRQRCRIEPSGLDVGRENCEGGRSPGARTPCTVMGATRH